MVTTVTADRNPLFSKLFPGRLVVHEIVESVKRNRCQSMAYVVMPDHLHWLFALREGHCIGDVVGSVKRYSATSVNRYYGSTGPVWQRGFHDHALRREEDIIGVARYIIANPLRAGLVTRIGDYPLWDAAWL